MRQTAAEQPEERTMNSDSQYVLRTFTVEVKSSRTPATIAAALVATCGVAAEVIEGTELVRVTLNADVIARDICAAEFIAFDIVEYAQRQSYSAPFALSEVEVIVPRKSAA
jgi:hypothetical protein